MTNIASLGAIRVVSGSGCALRLHVQVKSVPESSAKLTVDALQYQFKTIREMWLHGRYFQVRLDSSIRRSFQVEWSGWHQALLIWRLA